MSFQDVKVSVRVACPSVFVDTITSMDGTRWTGPGTLSGTNRDVMLGVAPGVVVSFKGGEASLVRLTLAGFTGADAFTVSAGAAVNVSLSTFSDWLTEDLRADTRAAFITAWGRGTTLTTEGVVFTNGHGRVGGALSVHDEAVHRGNNDTFALCSSSTDGGAVHIEVRASHVVVPSHARGTSRTACVPCPPASLVVHVARHCHQVHRDR